MLYIIQQYNTNYNFFKHFILLETKVAGVTGTYTRSFNIF